LLDDKLTILGNYQKENSGGLDFVKVKCVTPTATLSEGKSQKSLI